MLEEEYQPRRVLPPHLRPQPEPEPELPPLPSVFRDVKPVKKVKAASTSKPARA